MFYFNADYDQYGGDGGHGHQIDQEGKTNITGLYAAGEVSSAGIHGANRLASNSLLDGLVFGYRAAVNASSYNGSKEIDQAIKSFSPKKVKIIPSKLKINEIKDLKQALKKTMWSNVGIIRKGKQLKLALAELKKLNKKMKLSNSNLRIPAKVSKKLLELNPILLKTLS